MDSSDDGEIFKVSVSSGVPSLGSDEPVPAAVADAAEAEESGDVFEEGAIANFERAPRLTRAFR